MALSNPVSSAEVSSNPATGKITGDQTPGSTQNGVITKLRDADSAIATALSAQKTIFDSHDHDPANPTGGGGRQIGDGGVTSISTGAITTALINAKAVTGGKTANGAINTSNIVDESIAAAQVGVPAQVSNTVNAGESWTWTHGKGRYIQFCVAGNGPEMETATIAVTTNAITIANPSGGAPLPVTIYYRS